MTQALNNFALVFPGQGSQSIGMLAELSKKFPEVLQTFAEASDVLGYDAWKLCQQGPAEKLNSTEYTQAIVLAADIAIWRCWLAQQGPLPSLVAGHSLGEYSALVCAEALNFSDAIRLVSQRGKYMQQAVANGAGAMAAIVGLNDVQVQQICAQANVDNYIVSPANFNAIGQTVIAGHTEAVKFAIEFAKAAGAKLAKLIPVSVPSHCALMAPAAQRLAKDLKSVHISQPTIEIIHNVDVKSHFETDAICNALTEQLTHPVRWVETIQNMVLKRITVVVECGPGKVLTGLNKRIAAELLTYPTADMTQFDTAMNALRGVLLCH